MKEWEKRKTFRDNNNAMPFHFFHHVYWINDKNLCRRRQRHKKNEIWTATATATEIATVPPPKSAASTANHEHTLSFCGCIHVFIKWMIFLWLLLEHHWILQILLIRYNISLSIFLLCIYCVVTMLCSMMCCLFYLLAC